LGAVRLDAVLFSFHYFIASFFRYFDGCGSVATYRERSLGQIIGGTWAGLLRYRGDLR
jgi:hypothetical protein